MPAIPNQIKDRACQDLINRVYEAASSWDGSAYTVHTTCRNGKRRYLGMSGIGKECYRALWYGFRGFDPVSLEGRTRMIFELGDHIEQIQIHWLEAAGYRITDRQASYSDHNGFFRGHPDGIIHGVTKDPHVWDAKSINKKGMEALKKAGMKASKPIYYAQAQMMMHYSGYSRALYTFMCKDNSEWYAERFYYNEEHAIDLILKAKNIITSNGPHIRPFEHDSLECQWCDFKLQCYYPEETILSEKTCGTCFYMGWKPGTVKPYCHHPNHPFHIKTWGISCEDWLYMFHKEAKGREKHPDKVML